MQPVPYNLQGGLTQIVEIKRQTIEEYKFPDPDVTDDFKTEPI